MPLTHFVRLIRSWILPAVLVLTGCWWLASCNKVDLPADSAPAPTQAAVQKSALPRMDHVVIVVEENCAYKKIIGSPHTPYINALARQGALFSNSYAVAHPSQPNYLALFSGSTQGVSNDSCPHTFSAPNLASELLAKGLTFSGFSESLPAVGFAGCATGTYARKHCPWVNFSNVPAALHQPWTSFPRDFNRLPTVCFVIPDEDNDMHDRGPKYGDAWLRDHLAGYVQWAPTHRSLLILTFDEDDDSAGNHIATIFLGARVKPGVYRNRINHYTILRTLEDIYGLTPLGHSATTSPLTEVWVK